jgi:hypothetical protein
VATAKNIIPSGTDTWVKKIDKEFRIISIVKRQVEKKEIFK